MPSPAWTAPLRLSRRTWLLLALLGTMVVLRQSQPDFLRDAPASLPAGATHPRAEPRAQQLRLGPRAGLPGAVAVSIAPPIELDGLTREAVLALRTAAVARHARLFEPGYAPAADVFGEVADARPWWGMTGMFVHGSGPGSSDGPSEEARFIQNPLALVGVFCTSPSIWDGDFSWNRAVTQAGTAVDELALTCSLLRLEWRADEARAEAEYGISAWLAALNRYTPRRWARDEVWLDLSGLNARDMGLRWVLPDLPAAHNVVQARTSPGAAIELRDFLHRGGSCGIPGGCNNASPYQPALADFRLTALPARLPLHLWHDRPAAVTSAPDFRYEIVFR